MNTELLDLKDKLQTERQQLAEKLNEIDNKLSSINTVLDLLEEQHPQINTTKTTTTLSSGIIQKSEKLKNLPFKKAVKLLLKDNPLKSWTPKEIFEEMLKEGFQSNSKNFKNTARTMLMHMRKKNEIKAIKTEKGYLYMYQKEGSDSHMDESEPKHTGDVPERFKGPDL